MSIKPVLWAPLVYGRTYELDFRLIAQPEDFDSTQTAWALKHIYATTTVAERLPSHPRWSLFRNNHYLVIGVTCILQELLETPEYTKDAQNRSLYCFVGYVAKLSHPQEVVAIPPYAEDLGIFLPLGNYIIQQWEQTHLDIPAKRHLPTSLPPYPPTNISIKPTYLSTIEGANKNNEATLWPDSSRAELWQIVSKADFPVSVCLGLPGKKYIINDPFLNGTADDLDKPDIQKKPNESWRECDEVFSTVKERSDQNPLEKITTQLQEFGEFTKQKGIADVNTTINRWENFTESYQKAPQPPPKTQPIFKDLIVEKHPKQKSSLPQDDRTPDQPQKDWF